MSRRAAAVALAAVVLAACGPSEADTLACHHFWRSMEAGEAGNVTAAHAEINRAQQHAESDRVIGALARLEEGRRTGDDARLDDVEELARYCPDGTGGDAHAEADTDAHPHVVADP